MSSILNPIHQGKSWVYDRQHIAARSTQRYQTHSNRLANIIFRSGQVLAAPALEAARAIISLKSFKGAAGAKPSIEILKAIGALSFSILVLPAVLLGVGAAIALRPGRGKDRLMFLDASKSREPLQWDKETLHLMTYNVAGLPTPSDAIKDVPPPKKRMKEFVKWINAQKEKDLPLVIALQESFNIEGAHIITNGIAKRYPYSVTSAGRAKTTAVGSNSGLQIHSRLPIVGAAFFPFQDLVGFGVKCSDRGLLRAELDLGDGSSALIYTTHTQAHAQHAAIRINELALIRAQMRLDRLNDLNEGIDRNGHYYLMGDLNIGNIDDVTLNRIDEHNARCGVTRTEEGHFQETEVPLDDQILHRHHFYDPYFEDHNYDGNRTSGAPQFLNPEGEPTGSFYLGLERKTRKEGEWGTKTFGKGTRPVVDGCRLDYVLRLEDLDDFELAPTAIKPPKPTAGRAEIRRLEPPTLPQSAISDHLPLSAFFAIS